MALPARRVDMVVGSPEWAKSTADYAKDVWESRERTEERWQRIVDELEAGRAWVPLGYPSLDALLVALIGVTTKQSVELATAAARQQGPMPTLAEAGAKGGRGHKASAIGTGFKRGSNDAKYLARRLLRDAPDIFAALERGEYVSVRAAAKAAGLVKDKTPLEQLHHWWGKASAREQEQFRAAVQLDALLTEGR